MSLFENNYNCFPFACGQEAKYCQRQIKSIHLNELKSFYIHHTKRCAKKLIIIIIIIMIIIKTREGFLRKKHSCGFIFFKPVLYTYVLKTYPFH